MNNEDTMIIPTESISEFNYTNCTFIYYDELMQEEISEIDSLDYSSTIEEYCF